MSNAITSHPEPERLLRYVDGELGAASAQEIAKHLMGCGTCRSWLDDLKMGEAAYARTWMQGWRKAAAPPPLPWPDLRKRMTELDETPARVAPPARFWPQWAAIAAGILLAAIALQWAFVERVSAAGLLRQAATREGGPAQPRVPIRITSRSRSLVRPAVWRRLDKAASTDRTQQQAASLQVLFEAARYSWEDPLSAQSFSAWRKSLPDRKDRVVKVRGDDGSAAYEITTQTASGALAEAQLSLRVSDLHAYRGSLRFRDSEYVVISEMVASPVEGPTKPPLVAEAPHHSPGDPSWTGQPGVAAAPEPVTPSEELRVWAALRRMNADLGEPIDVERNDLHNVITVTALGMPLERRRVLEDALRGMPRVEVQFQEPQGVRSPSHDVSGARGTREPPLQPELEAQFGSRTVAEEFTNRILEASEACLLRAHAIRKLAQRFPSEMERQLPAQDQSLLQSIYAEHFAGLTAASRTVLVEGRRIAATVDAASTRQPATWQAQASSVVAAVERVDQLLTRMLAVAGATAEQPTLAQELGHALSGMEAEITTLGTVPRRAR